MKLMTLNPSITIRAVVLVTLAAGLAGVSSRLQADTGNCGGAPTTLVFTDVPAGNIFFCSIASAYFAGLTNGTTPTTYSPSEPVLREQMAAFVSRTLDQSVKRGNRRAALGEWWTNQGVNFRFYRNIGLNPRFLACDGLTVWVSTTDSNAVSRIDIRTGNEICTVTGIPSPEQIVVVGDYVWVASAQAPGKVHVLSRDTTVNFLGSFFVTVGNNPIGLTFDGRSLWTANDGFGPGTGSITRVSLDSNPPIITTFPMGFSQPRGILFDGANLWVTDVGEASLKRVDRNTGAVLQATALSGNLQHPIFDGTNLWIPSAAALGMPDRVFVIRGVGGLLGSVIATLSGNGMNGAFQAAFDGERICVTNAAAHSVSLWKATDLSPIGSVDLTTDNTTNSRGICSDGIAFFIGIRDSANSRGLFCRF